MGAEQHHGAHSLLQLQGESRTPKHAGPSNFPSHAPFPRQHLEELLHRKERGNIKKEKEKHGSRTLGAQHRSEGESFREPPAHRRLGTDLLTMTLIYGISSDKKDYISRKDLDKLVNLASSFSDKYANQQNEIQKNFMENKNLSRKGKMSHE